MYGKLATACFQLDDESCSNYKDTQIKSKIIMKSNLLT